MKQIFSLRGKQGPDASLPVLCDMHVRHEVQVNQVSPVKEENVFDSRKKALLPNFQCQLKRWCNRFLTRRTPRWMMTLEINDRRLGEN